MQAEGEVVTFARRRLLRRIESAKKRIWLVSPFISAPTAAAICRAATDPAVKDRRLLTALDARSVQCGALNTDALKQLYECEFKIASIANLHAKVSLVDSTWGLVGSGNLTGAGLGGDEGGGNFEMGVLLTPDQLEIATGIVTSWWNRADGVGMGDIERYAALPKVSKSSVGDFGPVLAPPHTAKLEEILAEDVVTAASRRYWINTNYHDPMDEHWWDRNWVSDGSKKPYEVGDLLVVYLGKENGGPQRCPAILGVVEPSSYDRAFVLEKRDFAAAEKWPFVTRTAVVADVPLWMGARLATAGKTYHSVQRGCEINRQEFEALAYAMLG